MSQRIAAKLLQQRCFNRPNKLLVAKTPGYPGVFYSSKISIDMKPLLKLCALTCLCISSAHAEIYMCKDATGRTLTADRVLPECADRAIRKYGKTGMVHKDIPAPPTPEQRREAIAQHDKQKAELAAAEAKRKDDQAFLARFPSEKRIEDERSRATIYIKEKIAEQGKEVYMVEKANDRNNADKARQALYQSQQMLANINLKYDQLLVRYREIETEQ